MLVCWWWWFGRSFARLSVLSVTTTFIILSSNKIQNGDILVPAYTGCSEQWPLDEFHVVLLFVMTACDSRGPISVCVGAGSCFLKGCPEKIDNDIIATHVWYSFCYEPTCVVQLVLLRPPSSRDLRFCLFGLFFSEQNMLTGQDALPDA